MDLQVIENKGNGGDIVKTNKDLVTIEGLQNMPYIAMFGGNVEASTPTERNENELAFDWWGNNLLHPNQPKVQFNSLTEKRLLDVALNSAGRIQIEEAIKKDLEFMSDFATVSVSASIVSTDRIEIAINIQEPDNLEGKTFIFIWNATDQELIIE